MCYEETGKKQLKAICRGRSDEVKERKSEAKCEQVVFIPIVRR
jgi:hypothetical protein